MLTGPRGGRARCVDGGVSVVCVRCHGVSPFWARIRWAGPRVRVYAHTDPVPGAPQAVCSQGASAAHLLLVLPGPQPRRVLPASTPGQGCGFGVWRLGSDGARSADGCGESRCAQGVGSSRNGVSSGLRVSPSPSVVGVSWVSEGRLSSPSTSVVGVSGVSEDRAVPCSVFHGGGGVGSVVLKESPLEKSMGSGCWRFSPAELQE